MAGLRGHLYRSTDKGLTWREIPSGTQQSLTAMVQHADGSVRIVGVSGVSISGSDQKVGLPLRFSSPSGKAAVSVSQEQDQDFKATVRADRAGLTSVVTGPTGDVLFSILGVVSDH